MSRLCRCNTNNNNNNCVLEVTTQNQVEDTDRRALDCGRAFGSAEPGLNVNSSVQARMCRKCGSFGSQEAELAELLLEAWTEVGLSFLRKKKTSRS